VATAKITNQHSRIITGPVEIGEMGWRNYQVGVFFSSKDAFTYSAMLSRVRKRVAEKTNNEDWRDDLFLEDLHRLIEAGADLLSSDLLNKQLRGLNPKTDEAK
jgi:hypothetical protein